MSEFILANYWVVIFMFVYVVAVAWLLVIKMCREWVAREAARAEQRRTGARR